jgi:molybdopterin molybdotransferase
VTPHPVQDSSMLSVLAASEGFLVRPAHDPARRAGDVAQVVDFGALPGGY